MFKCSDRIIFIRAVSKTIVKVNGNRKGGWPASQKFPDKAHAPKDPALATKLDTETER